MEEGRAEARAVAINKVHYGCAAAQGIVKATLNMSLAHRAPLLWAVCSVANPRDSYAIAVVCALHPIPNQGARYCGDLFSVALGSIRKLNYVPESPVMRRRRCRWPRRMPIRGK